MRKFVIISSTISAIRLPGASSLTSERELTANPEFTAMIKDYKVAPEAWSETPETLGLLLNRWCDELHDSRCQPAYRLGALEAVARMILLKKRKIDDSELEEMAIKLDKSLKILKDAVAEGKGPELLSYNDIATLRKGGFAWPDAEKQEECFDFDDVLQDRTESGPKLTLMEAAECRTMRPWFADITSGNVHKTFLAHAATRGGILSAFYFINFVLIRRFHAEKEAADSCSPQRIGMRRESISRQTAQEENFNSRKSLRKTSAISLTSD